MIRHSLFAALTAVIGYGCYDLGQRGARAYERLTVARVANGLEVLGYDWARLEADGLRLELHGHAPDRFARELALESARAMAPIARITSYATATLAPPAHRDPVRVELLRDERGVTMTGQTASRPMRERLNATLAEDGPELTVQDLTGIQAAQPPRGWGREIAVASLAASRLANAYVVMEPGIVTIDGQAADEPDRERLTQALLDRAGAEMRLVLRIRIPAKVIAPFAFSALKHAGAGIRLERCAARSHEERAMLLDRLARIGVEHQPDACPIGLGGPGGEWGAAAAAGLEALTKLPAGRIDIEYRHAQLIGAPPTPPRLFAEVATSFLGVLPDGFEGAGELRADDVATLAGMARDRFWMHLVRGAEGVTLRGQVPDPAARAAIVTEAHARFGAGEVEDALLVSAAPPPAGWQRAALRALGYLEQLTEGAAELTGTRVMLRGRIGDPRLAGEVHARMVEELPGYRVGTALRIDLPAALAALPLPPVRCAAELNRLNRELPIDFAAGSAVITAESAPVLDRLAAVLERCAGAPIQIAGHTDAQGSASLNERLSQARADAVVGALAARGVPLERMVATGFGESMPIASNESAAGRARNRRIEFEPAG